MIDNMEEMAKHCSIAFVLDEKKAKAFFDACDKVDEQGRSNFDLLMERYHKALHKMNEMEVTSDESEKL